MMPSWMLRAVRASSGLRGRLIGTFVVVMVLGAAAAAWAGVQQSTASLIRSHTDSAAAELISRVTQASPSVRYPPRQDSLDQLRNAVGVNSLVSFDDHISRSGFFASGWESVPPDLRSAITTQERSDEARVSMQRVESDGAPWLVIGTPVMITSPGGQRTPSGIEVYAAYDLTGVDEQVDALVRNAATTTALVLPVAVLLAILASRSVLRPVARLRATAQSLASGDLTARSESAGVDELAQLTRTVNEMAESLQSSMESMAQMEEGSRRFAADVSHELRTPLSTLTAAVEVLHDVLARADYADLSDEDARESAELAFHETQRLVTLVEDIMEVARFDAGTTRLRRETVDVAEVAQECVSIRGWSDDVRITRVPESSASERTSTVCADRARLDVILANLIGNAVTHGDAPVHVEISTRDGGVSVAVIDSGPGIPPNDLPFVFTRFYKTDASRTRTHGSGLGLAIARENAIVHGGTLTAQNRDDGGAEFTLWLPVNVPDASETPKEDRP
ncbi:sensor histidine kinase [Paramicrobacterium chengjingii]|uniref:histidine kinase n=1 Tax=Paramicrobacterium chengjingii TaxID=2769067 RepID=A0ABX6YKW6_9MICO|nr:HAMP domain-containing sensor histidine kinase [Microbacterium chengjingii]QPZ39443.1 HAMP domain-containing histidine kinase [Microbacterium chengjingii]